MTRQVILTAVLLVGFAAPAFAAEPTEPLAPITSVQVGQQREVRVNGKGFLPIMSWLQNAKTYPRLRSLGINTFCGNYKTPASEILKAARAAGGYGVYAFDPKAVGDANLLAWLHGDEPDLPHNVYDAKVTRGKGMRINRSCPLTKIFDGVTHTWSVLDPMVGAEVTVELAKPATVEKISVWLTASKGLALAKDVRFLADGKEVLAATLKPVKGAQALALPRPVTFRRLTMRVVSATPGKNEWGSIGEIQAFDAAGKNVLLSPPRSVPRMTPEALAEHFAKIKRADTSRPVFVTFTAYFMREFHKYPDDRRLALYRAWAKSCDVVGFDVYPIYGWNKPEWIDYVAKGTKQLCEIAGPKRPVYAWIESCKGCKYVTYSRQKDVLPMHTRAEVWMALIEGATAIGYFTHAWQPKFSEFNCTPDMQQELKRLNAQLTRLTPALLAPPAKAKATITLPAKAPCHVKATSRDGDVYLFAQNLQRQGKTAKATFGVEGLKAGATIEVVDENRTLRADAPGEFHDTFAPLQEHIYRIQGVR